MKKLSITKRDLNKGELSPYEQGVGSFHDMVNRFFDDPWFKMPSVVGQSMLDKNSAGAWWPKSDISETEKEIKIKMNVPGVDPSDIKIEVNMNTLVISGSTEKEEEEKSENWYRAERESGEFRRSFEIPNGCDTENVGASSKHGSILITIPKKPEAQKKRIDIKIKE